MKKSYYFAAMDECLSALTDAVNAKREMANFYRTQPNYKDEETGKPKKFAEDKAAECDALADEMENAISRMFNF